jgi:hypothetical protein
MSKNIIFVLMYHRHKLLDLIGKYGSNFVELWHNFPSVCLYVCARSLNSILFKFV